MVMAPRSPVWACAGLTAVLSTLMISAGSAAAATECPASIHTLLRPLRAMAAAAAMIDQAPPTLATLRDQASATVDTSDEIVHPTKNCEARSPRLVRQARQAP
jgi:hypothetical protein